MTAARKSFRIYWVVHADGRRSGILLRRWDSPFERPAPAAYGETEAAVQAQLELQVAEALAADEDLSHYLWDEVFEVHRVKVDIHPQTLVKKQPVVGKQRVPLRLTYIACKLASGAYWISLPRFGWWLRVESLQVAAESLGNTVTGALIGTTPRWLYDFRREVEEYVTDWTNDAVERITARAQALEEEETEFPELEKIAEELVERAARRKLPVPIGESADMRRLETLVDRYPPPSLLLVGDSGVGKTTLVIRLARYLAHRKKTRKDDVPRIWRTSGERIIAGMVYLGMWQKRCFDLVDELYYEGDYLYVDRLTSVVRRQSDGASIADLLLPALQAEEISLLAECSEAELAHCRRQLPALIDQFEIVRMAPTPANDVPALLQQYLSRQHSAPTVHPSALARIVHYLDAFQPTTCFPGKGFRFLDWLVQQRKLPPTLYPADVSQAFSRYSGLPVQIVADEVLLPATEISRSLKAHLIGQDHACETCAEVLARFKARIDDPERPVGTLLFVGPTGVGKTELAKTLARYLFGDEQRLVRLDMSEYMSAGSSQRLLETDTGGGSLVDKVRTQPLSVVLLDEIEKAHPLVFDLLLGVLGEGRLTDVLGRRVDFRMTVIVMTSNLGVVETAPPGFGERQHGDFIRQVRQHFRPEFFNRLDQIICFRPLSPEDILGIVDLELGKLHRRAGLERRRIELRVDDEARQMLARRGFHPTRGARPLKRVIEELIVTPLAVRLAQDPSLENRPLALAVEDGALWQRLTPTQRRDVIALPR